MPDPQKPVVVAPDPAAPDRALNSSIHSIGAQAPGAGKARRSLLRGLRVMVFAGLALLAAGCGREPPEEAVRAALAAMVEAAEARDAAAIAGHVSVDFAGPGSMDREQFRRTLAVAWLRDREIGVSVGPVEVEVIGERARTRFTAATRGGEGWLPDRAQVYRVDAGWRLEDGEWKLLSAEWEPVL